VVGRASSFRFRAPDVDPRQVGRELDAGRPAHRDRQRAGGVVRVSAELVDTRTGRQLWSQTFDRPMGDLFALEDEIARAITDALRVRLAGGALVRRGTTNPAAHDLVLRAKALYRQADEASVERAVALYGQALALDSGYAAAWAGLSGSYGQLADAFRAPTEMVPLAERAALRAVALDDSLAAAHVALAEVRGYWQWRFPDMRRELARALALDPSSTEAHLDHAIYLELIDEDLDGAERAIQAAAALDPFNPAVVLRQMSIAELRATGSGRCGSLAAPRSWPAGRTTTRAG
jgi:serine/threonine-protein kinase